MIPSILIILITIATVGMASADDRRGMVASVHPAATEAGLRVLKEGGNAVDAAVAVALTLGWWTATTPASGAAASCSSIARTGRLVAIDGRETAPAAATPDMFVRNGKADTQLSQTGPLASGVPGALAAYEFAVEHYGKQKLSDLILPAAEIAEKGFALDASYARCLERVADDMAQFPSSRAVFFKNGKPLAQGDMLKQPDLAATYRSIAAQGSDWFYRGPFAQAVEQWMKRNGGILTAEDFRNYRIFLREPILSTLPGLHHCRLSTAQLRRRPRGPDAQHAGGLST